MTAALERSLIFELIGHWQESCYYPELQRELMAMNEAVVMGQTS